MIGIFGGTFDPIHVGHLRPALDCLQLLGLTEVRFIPLNVAVHRAPPEAAPEQRLAMLEAAIADQPGFVADARELARPGASYSYETLLSLRAELGPARPLCLLIGADAFAGFPRWHRPLDILGLAHLVVMQRPGHVAVPDPATRALYQERGCDAPAELAGAPGGRILFQSVTQMDVSSSLVRQLIAAGHSPRYLLPESVIAIVERERLYR